MSTGTNVWQLARAVILRPEAFGGMAFHRQRGVTLEIDAEAYRFLCAYLEPHPLPPLDHPAAHLVPQLVSLDFLQPASAVEAQGERTPPSPGSQMGDGFTLTAPETVHLAITTRCNLDCPGCYLPHDDAEQTWRIDELHGLIDQWARMRVFQLAVGGGEPLLYEGLFDVLAYARRRGIVPNLTTNGTLLTPDVVRRLERAGVARINVSWNGPDAGGKGRETIVQRALRCLRDSTSHVGVNLLVTSGMLSGDPARLPRTLARIQALGVRRVTVLRPKPSATFTEEQRHWYHAHRLRRADLLRLRDILNGWQGALELEVGSALVSLMGDASAVTLRQRGVYGCAAGRRICTVWPDGRVTPCSFLSDLDAGDVCWTPFAELWRRGQYWTRLRDPTTRSAGGCAGCAHLAPCGGAICVARYEGEDMFSGDPECPHRQDQTQTTKEALCVS